MGMYATSANELKVYFNKDNFLTFRMHTDLNMDLIRWLRGEVRRFNVLGKRADKIEKSAVDVEDDKQFLALTQQADAIRSQGGDELDMMVVFVERACLGWTDYYEDQAAEERHEPLSFEKSNIARIGAVKLDKVITAFNEYYGLTEQVSGEAKSESLPALSQQEDRAVGSTLIGTLTSAPTAP